MGWCYTLKSRISRKMPKEISDFLEIFMLLEISIICLILHSHIIAKTKRTTFQNETYNFNFFHGPKKKGI